MKVTTSKKIISLLMLLSICVACFSQTFFAVNASADMLLYSSEVAKGTVFVGGTNRVVDTNDQLNTLIYNIMLKSSKDSYALSFVYDGNTYVINADMVKAKVNNASEDHYLLSPRNFIDNNFNIIQIAFTTCANKYDVLPINTHLIGRNVLTIMFEDKKNCDVYYWQAEMLPAARQNISININEDNDVVEKANELYYLSDVLPETITSEYNFDVKYDTYNGLNDNINEIQNNMRSGSNNNYYYALGVPNSIFKVSTNTWSKCETGYTPDGKIFSIDCIYRPYDMYGSNYIYTNVILIHKDVSLYNDINTVTTNGLIYSEAEASCAIDLISVPQTITYDPINNVFDLLDGGDSLFDVNEPSLNLYANSGDETHVLTQVYTYAKAKKNNLLGLGAMALKTIGAYYLDYKTGSSIPSFIADLFDIVSDANIPIGESVDGNDFYAFPRESDIQSAKYGTIIVGLKPQLKGRLRNEEHYFGMKCKFSILGLENEDVQDLRAGYSATIAAR